MPALSQGVLSWKSPCALIFKEMNNSVTMISKSSCVCIRISLRLLPRSGFSMGTVNNSVRFQSQLADDGLILGSVSQSYILLYPDVTSCASRAKAATGIHRYRVMYLLPGPDAKGVCVNEGNRVHWTGLSRVHRFITLHQTRIIKIAEKKFT